MIIKNSFSVFSLFDFFFTPSDFPSIVLIMCVCVRAYVSVGEREWTRSAQPREIDSESEGETEAAREKVMTVSFGIRNQTLSK